MLEKLDFQALVEATLHGPASYASDVHCTNSLLGMVLAAYGRNFRD